MDNTFQSTTFTEKSYYDTLEVSSLIEEDNTMLARYHFENIIYLYGVFERSTAYKITEENNYSNNLTLYETPLTALKATAGNNYKEPKILRFAVDISSKGLTYDELIYETKEFIKKSKLTKEEYIKQAEYIRGLDRKRNRVYYEIRNKKRIVNVQII